MVTATIQTYLPPSIFDSGFSNIRNSYIATKKLLAPAVHFLALRITTLWQLSKPYVHATAMLLATPLGRGVALLSIATLPIALSQMLQAKSKLLAAICLVAGVAIAITGLYYLGAVGIVPAIRIGCLTS